MPAVFGMTALDFLNDALGELEASGLLRTTDADGEGLLDVCSNDYLAFGRERVSRATLLTCEGLPTGAGASRLIFGTAKQHLALEAELADWTALESALLFANGYAANVGLLQALCRGGDWIVSDALNHASIIDGCRLSRGEVRVVAHRDVGGVEQALREGRGRRSWVVTESYFSMDGDVAPLRELRQVCDAFGAGLLVDEAHALGVFGPGGSGLCRAAGIAPDALVGTLGKAVGVQGAFVAGPSVLRRWLWNRARSLVFSTAPSPLVAQLALLNVQRARGADAERARLHALADELRARLRTAGATVPSGTGPIVPLILGDDARALRAAAALRALGLRVQAIRPPTVPAGSARLRLTVSCALSDADVAGVAECLIRTCSES
jgi:8-amino-7-oxononanoate synthase